MAKETKFISNKQQNILDDTRDFVCSLENQCFNFACHAIEAEQKTAAIISSLLDNIRSTK